MSFIYLLFIYLYLFIYIFLIFYIYINFFILGIGVTPFASILRELLLVKKDGTDKLYPKVERVYFYWTARDHRNFEWFDELLNSKFISSFLLSIKKFHRIGC